MRTVVITGANAGIGFATAKFIARYREWHVVLACRNQAKAQAALNVIRESDSEASVSFLPLDLFSVKSVRHFAGELEEQGLPPLQGLILNAGGIIIDPKFAGISGRYFDGTTEIPSSAESRDESKAKTVWDQAQTLAEFTD